ncbi:HAD-IA family hydrolase [Porticoccus sp. W117]|uniref:HAD-IA family hydrolase n=1 Tax=Porticoccus sp. W117 TaxID=3054777 RepID=UPI002598B8FF|nr:HAD-IA family hydrolase [Porticoccus sp. W117]MDM3872145.1 HAD-IA family hydrolase [Porticoccus sp. W117]
MTKLLIFDWDGTLSDSLSRIAFCMQRAAEDCQLQPPTVEEVRNIVGLGLREAIAILYPHIEDDGLIERIKEDYSRHFLSNDKVPSPFYPHVMESLERLREQGHILTVATGKSRRGLNRVLAEKGLDSFFHGSRCADETRSKPHPQMINELLQEFDVQPSQAIMVGDTEYDLEMAVNAQVPGLGVSYGAHSVERLQKHKPFAVVDCFSQVEEAIRGHESCSSLRGAAGDAAIS